LATMTDKRLEESRRSNADRAWCAVSVLFGGGDVRCPDGCFLWGLQSRREHVLSPRSKRDGLAPRMRRLALFVGVGSSPLRRMWCRRMDGRWCLPSPSLFKEANLWASVPRLPAPAALRPACGRVSGGGGVANSSRQQMGNRTVPS
jgi:hypothetical protein